MASRINEDLMKTNLDLPEGEIKLDGVINPVYADAINVHNKKKKETEKVLKDKKPELKKAFLGTKGETTVMPRTPEMKKLKLSEDMFRNIREHYEDAPDTYQNIFRIVDNMEHIINYINELSDEEMTYEDMQQSYDVLEGELSDFSDCLFELRASERRKGTLKEAAVLDYDKIDTTGFTRKDWELLDKKLNKDIRADIYNELVDMKDIETPHRQLKKTPKQRYSGGWEEEGVRVAPSRTDDAIVVYADDESQLAHAKEVADAYGVEFTIKEHTSRYAEARFEMKIYPTRHVTNESLDTAKAFGRKAKNKDLNESANGEIYSKVVKYFEYGAPGETVDTVCDIVDRAISNIEDGYELDEAIGDALDSGLIYHKDLWAIKHYYEDSELLDGTYESLYNDIYSITSDLVEDDDVDEGLTSAQRHNRKMDRIFQDKKDRDSRMSKFLKDNSDITDDELKKVQDDDKVGLELKNRGLHDRYWNEVEGKKESLKESKKSRTVVLDNFNDEYVNDPEFLSAVTEILGPNETYGGSIRQIKDFAITVTVDVGTDMTAGSYGCKFKALVDGDLDSDYVSEQWIEFDLSSYDNLVYQCWWEKESGEDEYYPTCDVITMYRRDISSDIINAYLQVDGEAIMYMLEPIETALYDYVSAPDDFDESLKESYTKVDTIECGEETYRVVSGGFNPTADALVTVEDEHGERTRIHIGDVIEFYTWYDKNGNVIHEPSMDESLDKKDLKPGDKFKAKLPSGNIETFTVNKVLPDAYEVKEKTKDGNMIYKVNKSQVVNEDLKIYRESDLSDFEFWSGARDTVKYLTDDEVRQIGQMLEEIYPDGCTETDINDFFWFEDDTIAEWLGYESFEEIMEREKEE